MDAAEQLELMKVRHAQALAFIDHKVLRIEYDEWMAKAGLASEFVTQPRGGKLVRDLREGVSQWPPYPDPEGPFSVD
jgi:hypothetical protein